MKTKLKDLRKQVNEGIKNGSIKVLSKHKTKSISRLISYLDKHWCLNVIGSGRLDLSLDAYKEVIEKSNIDKRKLYQGGGENGDGGHAEDKAEDRGRFTRRFILRIRSKEKEDNDWSCSPYGEIT